MSVTSLFLQNKSSLIKLKDLSDQMPAVSDNIKSLQALAAQGVLEQSEVDELVNGLKNQLKAIIQKTTDRAQQEGTMIASAAETEVYSKLKGATPVIAGLPVMANPTVVQSTAAEVSFLATVPTLANDLATMTNNFNSVLS